MDMNLSKLWETVKEQGCLACCNPWDYRVGCSLVTEQPIFLFRMCIHAKSLQGCLTVTLWTIAHQAPLSMGFSRQEYWTVLPCPPSRDLPDPGITPMSRMAPSLAGRSFTTRRPLSQRRQWHPTPVLLPGKSHGWRSLVGCSPWGH